MVRRSPQKTHEATATATGDAVSGHRSSGDTVDESAGSGPALSPFYRIARAAAAAIDYGLFTVTAILRDTMQVERVFSTDPSTYPVGGRKAKRDTAFARHVLVRGEPLVCEGDAAIADMFDDHATIRGCGLHASINAPVVGSDGSVLGVMNFLLRSDRVLPAQLSAARNFARDPAVIATLVAHAVRVEPGPKS